MKVKVARRSSEVVQFSSARLHITSSLSLWESRARGEERAYSL